MRQHMELAAAGQSVARFRGWLDELGQEYAEDYFVYQLPTGAIPGAGITLAPGATTQATLLINQEAAFEWIETAGAAWNGTTGAQLSNPNILVQITDLASGRLMFSNPIPWACFVGTAQQPFILPVPKRLLATNMFAVTLTNFDTVTTYSNVHITFLGRKIYLRDGSTAMDMRRFREWDATDPVTGEPRSLSEDVFAFVARMPNTFSIAPFAASDIDVFITPDADFEWIATTGILGGGAGTAPINFSQIISGVTFLDGGTERALQNVDVYGANVIGTALFPYVLPMSRLLLAKSSLHIRLAPVDTVIQLGNNVFIALWGRKIFEAG